MYLFFVCQQMYGWLNSIEITIVASFGRRWMFNCRNVSCMQLDPRSNIKLIRSKCIRCINETRRRTIKIVYSLLTHFSNITSAAKIILNPLTHEINCNVKAGIMSPYRKRITSCGHATKDDVTWTNFQLHVLDKSLIHKIRADNYPVWFW